MSTVPIWQIGAADGVAMIMVVQDTSGLYSVVARSHDGTEYQRMTARGYKTVERAKARAMDLAGTY